MGLTLEARGLWISGLCYAGTNGGVIPSLVVERFAPRRKLGHLIDELTAVRLWEDGDEGWVVHDFDEHCAWLSNRRERDRIRKRHQRDRLRQSRDQSGTVTLEREHRTVNYEHRTTPKPPLGDVRVVFDAWVASTGKERSRLDEKRTRVIRARLADYQLEDVLDAVRGWERDPWEGRKQQNGIEILLRDGAHLEKFRDLWRAVKPDTYAPTNQPSAISEEYRRRGREAFVFDPTLPSTPAEISAMMRRTAEAMAPDV